MVLPSAKTDDNKTVMEKLDIVPSTVVMYENGKRPIPYDVAIKLADVLEIEATLLCDDFSFPFCTLYEALKSVRTALRLSQKAFAERIGLYQATTIKSKKAIADRHERFIRRYMLRQNDQSTNFTFREHPLQ